MDVLISRTAAGDYAPLPDDTPSNLKDFVAGLLVVNPRERLGSSTIRQHALFEGTDWDSLATHTKTPGPIRGRTASSADSASLHCTQAELHEWQLPLVNRFFELRTDASLKTDAWGDIMEKMAIYIRPSLHFKYSTAMATCPLTKKHFVVRPDPEHESDPEPTPNPNPNPNPNSTLNTNPKATLTLMGPRPRRPRP
jgi:serine/threonine protein kinase